VFGILIVGMVLGDCAKRKVYEEDLDYTISFSFFDFFCITVLKSCGILGLR